MNKLDFVRGVVRPLVTFGLVATQAALTVIWVTGPVDAEKPFAALAPFTMMALTFWFRDRAVLEGSQIVEEYHDVPNLSE